MPNAYDLKLLVDKRRLAVKKTHTLVSRVVFGGSGAITSQTSYVDSGMVVTKTAATTGRYTINVPLSYKSVRGRSAQIEIGATAAATIADGNEILWRADQIGRSTKDGTIKIQFVRSDTMADANPTSGTVVEITLELEVDG